MLTIYVVVDKTERKKIKLTLIFLGNKLIFIFNNKKNKQTAIQKKKIVVGRTLSSQSTNYQCILHYVSLATDTD